MNIIIVFGLFHLTPTRHISIPTLNIQVSKEGEFFTVETEVARMSELVRGMLDGEKRQRETGSVRWGCGHMKGHIIPFILLHPQSFFSHGT